MERVDAWFGRIPCWRGFDLEIFVSIFVFVIFKPILDSSMIQMVSNGPHSTYFLLSYMYLTFHSVAAGFEATDRGIRSAICPRNFSGALLQVSASIAQVQ